MLASGEELRPDVIQAVEHRILQRTGRRVHQLHVELVEGRIVVSAWTPSWYMKQLTLQAVQEVVGSAAVELRIQVSAGRHAAGREMVSSAPP